MAAMDARTVTPTHPQRLHALDNLRAVMMWLGIVLHVAAMHMVAPTPLFWHDRDSSLLADLATAGIHSFRMPVFFVVAGFFVTMLVRQRGTGAMLKHRFRRIALPFLVMWLPLLVLMGIALMLFASVAKTGQWRLDPALLPPPPPGRPMLNTMHLWFIYQLWWFAVLAALAGGVGRRVSPALREALPRLLRTLTERPWGALLLAMPLLLAGAGYPNGLLAPHGSLLPVWNEWLHNGVFFALGCALWDVRDRLLPLLQARALRHAALGLPLFLASGVLINAPRHGVQVPHAELWIAYSYNLCSVFWSFAVIGLFLRHASGRSAAGAYLAESAYWVYLLHLPLTVLVGAALYHAPFGALPKMLLNIGATTVLCLASYQGLVRGRWLGRLLNGPPAAQGGSPPPLSRPMGA